MKKINKEHLFSLDIKVFENALKEFGSMNNMHKKCASITDDKFSLSTIRYSYKTKRMSAYTAYVIEKASDNRIKRSELIPNFYKY